MNWLKQSQYLFSLSWLYLVQGIPYGLQDKFIPLQLRAKGHSYTSLSLMKALLLPWLTKGAWAPFIEVFGGRQWWLVIALMGLTTFSLSGSNIKSDDVWSIGCILLGLNVFSAVQDVVVDGMALELLPDEFLGIGNTIQVVMYKVGCLVGGAGFSYVMIKSSWKTVFLLMATMYLVTCVWATRMKINSRSQTNESLKNKNNENSKKYQKYRKSDEYYLKKYASTVKSKESKYTKFVRIVQSILKASGTLWLICYVVIYKMGERGAINNFPLFLLDKGLDQSYLHFWSGTICQGLSILGSFMGGITLAKPNADIISLLVSHSCQRLTAVALQCIIVYMWDDYELNRDVILFSMGVSSLCWLSYSSGVISTASFTLLMQASRGCQLDAQSSHYSLLASVEVAGKLLFASLAGFIIDAFGMSASFILFTSLCVLPIAVLIAMPDSLFHIKTQ
ncbi:unnamed protein product, partial [Meganyctiphanes norvegica]